MSTESAPLDPHCALVLDDNVFVASDFAANLEEIGFDQVIAAHSLAEAQRMFETYRPSCALLDYSLGQGANSLDLGMRLADLGVRVIFASGYSLSELPAVVSQFPFIEKPAAAETLRTMIGTETTFGQK